MTIHNHCGASMKRHDVVWEPLEKGVPETADLYIANRGDRLIHLVPDARARVFWIHNPAQYLNKWRYWRIMARWRPTVVFSSEFHARSIEAWMPTGGKETIPYGISEAFLAADPPADPPPPHVAFTSSPLRSLDWLLGLWEEGICPHVPGAELHVFSSPKTYGAHGDARADAMNAVLDRARTMAELGVVLRDPLSKADLAEALGGFRAILYRGDPGETYCLAVGEAQAMRLPQSSRISVASRNASLTVKPDLWPWTIPILPDGDARSSRMTNSGGVFTLLRWHTSGSGAGTMPLPFSKSLCQYENPADHGRGDAAGRRSSSCGWRPP